MRARRALALVALLALGACKRSSRAPEASAPPAPALASVTVEEATPPGRGPEGVRLNVAALQARAAETLSRSGLFARPATDAGTVPLARVRVLAAVEDVVVGDKAAARAMLRLRVDVRPSAAVPARWREDVEAGAEVPYRPADNPDRAALFQKLVARALDDVLAGYVSRLKLWSGNPAALAGVLKADAGELRLEAIRAVAERRLTSEVPALLKLLEDPDEPVRDAALGALVELRERRAVSVLAEQRSMRDKREMRKILDAIALLGGDEAADYLAFVADGHEDPEIRELAKDARARLLRRADAGR